MTDRTPATPREAELAAWAIRRNLNEPDFVNPRMRTELEQLAARYDTEAQRLTELEQRTREVAAFTIGDSVALDIHDDGELALGTVLEVADDRGELRIELEGGPTDWYYPHVVVERITVTDDEPAAPAPELVTITVEPAAGTTWQAGTWRLDEHAPGAFAPHRPGARADCPACQTRGRA